MGGLFFLQTISYFWGLMQWRSWSNFPAKMLASRRSRECKCGARQSFYLVWNSSLLDPLLAFADEIHKAENKLNGPSHIQTTSHHNDCIALLHDSPHLVLLNWTHYSVSQPKGHRLTRQNPFMSFVMLVPTIQSEFCWFHHQKQRFLTKQRMKDKSKRTIWKNQQLYSISKNWTHARSIPN